jgi:6-pyruvoyltetrahydropterin/6-carboxytetrahydropterin synthase
MTYEVGLSRTVRAFHVMPGMPPPEGERHHHDYRIEVVVERQDLDERAMVCDLDLLEAALADVVRRAGGETLATRVWESPAAFAGYRAPTGG